MGFFFFFLNPKPAPLGPVGPTQPFHNLGPKPWPNKKKGPKALLWPNKKNYVCLDSSPPIKRKIMFAQIQAA